MQPIVPDKPMTPNGHRTARVSFSETAWDKMMQLIYGYDKEVGWHGTVVRTGPYEYLIEDIIVYPQYVNSAQVVPDQAEYEEWMWDLDNEIFNKLRFHGHSHVNMSSMPSGVDMDFAEDIIRQLGPEDFYIFMIFNKRMAMHCRVYDMASNIMFKPSECLIVTPHNNNWRFLIESQNYVKEKK